MMRDRVTSTPLTAREALFFVGQEKIKSSVYFNHKDVATNRMLRQHYSYNPADSMAQPVDRWRTLSGF